MNTIHATLLALAGTAPALLADINVAPPATPTPNMPTRVQGNCDMLASNTIRATFRGTHPIQMQSVDDDEPTVMQVAIFEVVENLSYRRYVRYGDGALEPGARFTVAISREIPGQPAEIVDTIAQMQPGQEALMKIDHLYIYGVQEGKSIRPCSRMVLRNGAAAGTPAPAQAPAPAPDAMNNTPAPLPQVPLYPTHSSIQSRSVSVTMNSRGEMERVEVITEKLPGSNVMTTRMYINGVEVDPNTRQPITAPAPAPTPQPAQPAATPAPAPAAAQPKPQDKPAEDDDDDTIVERAPQNAAPTPAPTAPAANEGF